MRCPISSNPFGLLDVTVIVVLLLIVATHVAPAYESYKLRQRVVEGLSQASKAKALVEANFAKGIRLGQGWDDVSPGSDVSISVADSTGIITVTFPADIDGGGKTLALIPVYVRRGGDILPLTVDIKPKTPVQDGYIVWSCTSTLTYSNRSFIRDHLGTLQSKYAPAACRRPSF